jgi:hypothetical protein
MNTVTHTSWWATPQAQQSRDGFMAAHRLELERITTDVSAAAKVDALVTAQWGMGFPRGRKTSLGGHVAWSAR